MRVATKIKIAQCLDAVPWALLLAVAFWIMGGAMTASVAFCLFLAGCAMVIWDGPPPALLARLIRGPRVGAFPAEEIASPRIDPKHAAAIVISLTKEEQARLAEQMVEVRTKVENAP